jgi:phycocyanobilin:ferredoxin oxidoreductase
MEWLPRPLLTAWLLLHVMSRYPRFTIENRVYHSAVFRKIHMELAVRQDGMQIFHFVMYPWPAFDIPIFSLDMVRTSPSYLQSAIGLSH